MGLYLWNSKEHFRILPPIEFITRFGRRKWDPIEESKEPLRSLKEHRRTIFSMPSFGRHGRWGNMVFQYIFIRIFAQNNDADIELYRDEDWLNKRMSLYDDMVNIPGIQTKSESVLIDSYQLFPSPLNNIPPYMGRALFFSEVRGQKCYILENTHEVIHQPLPFHDYTSMEVEGLFMVNPKLYTQQHKDFLLKNTCLPNITFKSLIDNCVEKLGKGSIVGIHIRRGDFVSNPLGQLFQFPIPVKYIIEWLASNIPLLQEPKIYVCSDDPNAYKEIEMAGFEVFFTNMLVPEGEAIPEYEQLEWEILRRCDILLTSNSSFSFSAALLSTKKPTCHQFSLQKKTFVYFDPWQSEPLQFCTFSADIVSYFTSRFTLVWNMVSKRSAYSRLLKDIKEWVFWKKTRLTCLYYMYGHTFKYVTSVLNLLELFKVYNKTKGSLDYTDREKIRI